ncbi:minor capsid protein [Vagococcus elongatus]|uniref:Capsid protein n=1 Tax=Vagococcus elongatus TaxID=180344 RepID=A0A430AU43_9ENTE|nr:minor capsid protein [Vagococcus elongatus]RSU11570.1 hypothetical protein CBF29_07770 [Vagococcus elongatus]
MVKIKVDIANIERKLSAGNLKRARVIMMNQMLMDMQPFVPNDMGTLQQTGTIGVDRKSLHWVTPYAKPMYYGMIKNLHGVYFIKNWTTPGTGPYWDLRAKGLFMSDWEKVFLRGLGL